MAGRARENAWQAASGLAVGPLAGRGAKANFLGQAGTMLGITRRNHGVISAQAPAFTILIRRQVEEVFKWRFSIFSFLPSSRQIM